jgi:hypothetical protein
MDRIRDYFTPQWTVIPFAHKSMNIERDFQFIFKNRKNKNQQMLQNQTGTMVEVLITEFSAMRIFLNVREKRKQNCGSSYWLVANRSGEPIGEESQ